MAVDQSPAAGRKSHRVNRDCRRTAGALTLCASALTGGCISIYEPTAPFGYEAAANSEKEAMPHSSAAPGEAGVVAAGSDRSAPVDAPPRHELELASEPSLAYLQPSAAAGGLPPHDDRQPAELISLWGDELVRDPTGEAAGPLDGSANLQQVSFATEGKTFDPDIDPTGTQMAFASTQHRTTADIYLKPVDGTAITQLTADPANDVMPAFNPRGDRIAFASDRSGNWDIYVMSVEGGRPVQITSGLEAELHPSWSPDGTRLAYCRFGTQTNRWEIWVVNVENPSTPSFLTFGVFPQWSPDVANNKILFQRARERGSQFHSIWTIDYVGGDARRPTEIVSASNAALINPAWSRDGRKIAFVAVVDPQHATRSEPTRSDIWVVDLDGTRRMRVSDGEFGNYQPVWASGQRLYFVSNRSGVDNVWAVRTIPDLDHPADSMGVVIIDPQEIDSGGAP